MRLHRKIMISNFGSTMDIVISDLKVNDYDIMICDTAEETKMMLLSHCPDMLMICVNDPSGLSALLCDLREWSDIPILIACKNYDIMHCIEMVGGVIDFIVYPFSAEELVLRIERVLYYYNLCTAHKNMDVPITVGDMTIDLQRYRVYIGDRDVRLTHNEYKIVALLARQVGEVKTYDEIQCHLWGPNVVGGNQAMRVHIANIRRKIEDNASAPRYLHTVNGVGYRLAEKT